jgi:predicted polyphosphate/ATP-dependent NAD kinase
VTTSVGLIVNPIAGMGGPVALKGTDGGPALEQARARGAVPSAAGRATQALAALAPGASTIELLAWSEDMGARAARAAGLACHIMRPDARAPTSAADTQAAAAEMARRGVSLLLFAGGDGTARDVMQSVGATTPVLGIPAGVKMHSAVFAVNPRSAGRVARGFIESAHPEVRQAEVVDLDEDQLRGGRISPRLHGVVRVPAEPQLVQAAKLRSERSDHADLAGIAAQIADELDDETLAIFGPGTTTAAILRNLGIEPTLLGIDVVRGGVSVARDADERTLIGLVEAAGRSQVVVAPIGGQGFILGRGNQQISAPVLRRVGSEGLVVVCTESKLASLAGQPFLVDSGDAELDAALGGYIKAVTGHGRYVTYRVGA